LYWSAAILGRWARVRCGGLSANMYGQRAEARLYTHCSDNIMYCLPLH
jgi:hypothetical protein